MAESFEQTIDQWHEVWKSHPKTKIDRLNLSNLTTHERDLIKEKALELETMFQSNALFFTVKKSGKKVFLQVIAQIEI